MGMRRMRAGSNWLDAIRAGSFIHVAGAWALLCLSGRAEDFSSLTNTASLNILVQRARSGQTDAMFTLGNFLASRGDLTNATGWYRAGAERGEAKAQQAFAQCLASGRGVATNLAEAARWSALAAKTLNSNVVTETKATTNAAAVVSAMKVAPPASDRATNTSSTAFGALLAVISPAPLKVAAREVPSMPPRPEPGDSTNAPNAGVAPAVIKPPEAAAELARWRIPPEEVGDGIHFPRATNLPPLTPVVQDEPPVVRPPDIFR